jgi:hypothetical protein
MELRAEILMDVLNSVSAADPFGERRTILRRAGENTTFDCNF